MSAAAPRHKSRHRGIYYRNGSDDPKAPGPRRWIVWYRDSEGKGRTETLPEGSSEQDALQRQAELRGAKRRGERVMPTKATLRDAGEKWFRDISEGGGRAKKPRTLEAYRWGLEKAYKYIGGHRKLVDITTSDVANAICRMRADGLSGKSIKHVLTPVNRVFSRARRDHGLPNPVALLEPEERPEGSERQMRILDSTEILEVIKRTPEDFRVLIATLIYTGMRVGEALALRWADIDFEAGLITVREAKTKAGRGRQIVLMPSLGKKRLLEHRMASKFSDPQDLVFATKRGTMQVRQNVRARGLAVALAEKRDEHGNVTRPAIPHCRIHDLRHTFASLLIGMGLDVTFVADQLGHEDPAVTLRVYAKLFDPKRRRDEAREKLEAAFGGMV